MPRKLSAEQISRFHEQGYLAPITVLTQGQMAEYRRRLEAFEAKHPDDRAKIRLKANLLCPWIDELVCDSGVLDVLEDLIGPNILSWSPGFKIKNPDGRTYAGWHQDSTYIGVAPRYTLCTLAFTAHTVQSGCVWVVPGSHRGGQLPHDEESLGDCILSRNYFTTAEVDESRAVPVELEPGEMSVHQGALLHGSRPNHSSERRISLIMDYVPTDARQTGGEPESAMLVRGVDAYENFGIDPHPAEEMCADARAAWQKAVGAQLSRIYEGSPTAPMVER